MYEELQNVPSPDHPEAALAAVVSMRRLADRLELAAVQAALDEGWSWAQIADGLGISPQAAHKRLAGRVTSPRTRRRTS